MATRTELDYFADGFAFLSGVLDDESAVSLDRRVQRLYDSVDDLDDPPEDGPVVQIWRHQNNGSPSFVALDQLPELVSMLGDERTMAHFASMVRADYLQLFEAVAIVKPPKLGESFAWHSDASFFPFDEDSYASLWLATTVCDLETGGMTMARKSHLAPRWASVNVKTGDRLNDDSSAPLPPADPDTVDFPTMRADVKPGEAVVFHANTLHRSDPNRSSDVYRKGLVLRFVTHPTPVQVTEETRAKFVAHVRTDSEGMLLETPRMPIVWRRH